MYTAYSFFVSASVCAILYGLMRFYIASWRRDANAKIYALFIPGVAFTFVFVTVVYVWLIL